MIFYSISDVNNINVGILSSFDLDAVQYEKSVLPTGIII